MAFETLPRSNSSPSALQNGRDGFLHLLETLVRIREETQDGSVNVVDATNFKQMAAEIESAIASNMLNASAEHRQGFVRTLACYLDHVESFGESCIDMERWDSIRDTAWSFAQSNAEVA